MATGNVRIKTPPIKPSFSGANGSITFPVPAGYYNGINTATAVDTDLVAGNVKSGINIFGVIGTYTGSTSYSPIFPGQNIYAILSPWLYTGLGPVVNYQASAFSCMQSSGIIYYVGTICICGVTGPRNHYNVTCISTDNGGVITSYLIGTATTGFDSFGSCYVDHLLSGSDIIIRMGTSGTQGYISFNIGTLSRNQGSTTPQTTMAQAQYNVLGFSNSSIPAIITTAGVASGTPMTNSVSYGGHTYTCNILGDTSRFGYISGMFVATKV